jgi:uncharacterized protein (UPF0332 family)
MDARDFHTLAQRLALRGTPAEYRTAVSRAYYATFNVGAEILAGLGFSVRRGAAAHGEVYHCLSNSADSEVEDAASEINDLHRLRNRADYQLDTTDVESPAVVTKIVATAGTVIRTLDTAFTGPRRPQLQAAIAKWRRENGYP